LRMPMLPAEIPADARARVLLAGQAGVAIATRQAAHAATLLERLVAEYPETPNVHYAWGVLLLTSDPPRAIQVLQQEIERVPSHVPARLQIVYELVKQGDAEVARPYAEQAVAIAPGEFGPHLAMGQVQLGLGRLDAAITSLEKAVQLAPGSAQPFYVLSVAYARAGRQDDAARARAAFVRLSGDGARHN
jgi:predicted Zn-dependent protease